MEALMLKIDLSNTSYEIEEIPNEIIRKYIGGRGLGSYLLYKLVPGKVFFARLFETNGLPP
jgi:aldehyde:ferredoxin oxidoreductase